jgi:hypothetical protein
MGSHPMSVREVTEKGKTMTSEISVDYHTTAILTRRRQRITVTHEHYSFLE